MADDRVVRRRKRPHPARRARRIAGGASALGMLVVTGYLAAGAAGSGTSASETTRTNVATRDVEVEAGDDAASAATATTLAPATTATTANSSTRATQPTTATPAARAARVAPRPVTASRGS